MRKFIHLFVWILSISITVVSCSKEDSVSNDTAGKIARMNIADSKVLFIASSASGSKLYGIKKSSLLKSASEIDNDIYEIKYLDKNDKPIEDKIPVFIYNTGDFLIVFFKNSNGWVVKEEVYFVRKKDGIVIEVPNDYIPSLSGLDELIFNSNKNIRSFRQTNIINDMHFLNICKDKGNNIFYTAIRCMGNGSCPHTLYKVSSIGSSAINYKQVSAENETVWGYCVDDAGNILYSRAGGEWLRYVRADGAISEPIPVSSRTNNGETESAYRFIWKGTDGIMALLTVLGENDSEEWYTPYSNIKHFLMKIENGKFEIMKEISLEFDEVYPSSNNVFYVHGNVFYSHYFGNRNTLVNISNEKSYREIPCSVEANIVIGGELYNFDKYYFSLKRINTNNGATTPIFSLDKSALNDYIITSIMDITENGVMFGAYRLSDKMSVIAKIGLDSKVTILQSSSGEISVVLPLDTDE